MKNKRQKKFKKRMSASYYEGFDQMEELKDVLLEMKRCQF